MPNFSYIQVATAIIQEAGKSSLLPAFMLQVSELNEPAIGLDTLEAELIKTMQEEGLILRSYIIGYTDTSGQVKIARQKAFDLTLNSLLSLIPSNADPEEWIEANLSYKQLRILVDGQDYKDKPELTYHTYVKNLADVLKNSRTS